MLSLYIYKKIYSKGGQTTSSLERFGRDSSLYINQGRRINSLYKLQTSSIRTYLFKNHLFPPVSFCLLWNLHVARVKKLELYLATRFIQFVIRCTLRTPPLESSSITFKDVTLVWLHLRKRRTTMRVGRNCSCTGCRAYRVNGVQSVARAPRRTGMPPPFARSIELDFSNDPVSSCANTR